MTAETREQSACDLARRVADAVEHGRSPEPHLTELNKALGTLPAVSAARMEGRLRSAGALYSIDPKPQWWTPLRQQQRRTRDGRVAALGQWPPLAHLYLFHADGFVREAAIRALSAPPASSFEIAAIALRLNDWVTNVRIAARTYAERMFPAIAPEVAAAAAEHLLTQIELRRRWSEEDRDILTALFGRADSVAAMAERLMKTRIGPAARHTRQLLRNPAIDTYLPGLAAHAHLTSVRAVALDALVTRRARWITGFEQQWIDKTYGISRRVPVFAERVIAHDLDVEALVATAARDRATAIRKVACAWLIAHMDDLSGTMRAAVAHLTEDRSHSVRVRARFVLSRVAER